MGRVKEQMMWRSEHATDWEEDLPTWYQYHERELDQMVGEVIIYCVSGLVSDINKAFWKNPDSFELDEEQVINIFQKVDESFEEDGAEPTYFEALQHFIVADWFADELEKRGEIVDKDFLGLTIWGRPTYGQAISLDYVVQDVLKETVERRKANG
jgi:hypothetical protein